MSAYQPLVIIGAPRSGTNMLRDIVCGLPGVGTWPCDEINYIWRHGNLLHSSDEFTPQMARPGVRRYIRGHFDRLARRQALDTVVEKTCANSLRVGFVDAVLPDAKYLFIVRDGMDAVGSARLRWTADLDIAYLLNKARYVPPTDLPYYGTRYLANRLYRLMSRERRLAFWGPQLDRMDDLLVQHTLEEVCALQWQACVERAAQVFASIPERVFRLRYEDFVSRPAELLQGIGDFLGLAVTQEQASRLTAGVSSRSIGKGREQLGSEGVARLAPLIGSTLERFGYA